MKKLLYLIFLLLVLVLSLSGCPQSEDVWTDSPVIAKINKEVVTEDNFSKMISRIPEWSRNQFEGKEGKEKFLDELIKRELIYQEAKKMRLHKDEEYLAQAKEFEKMALVNLILKKEVDKKITLDDDEAKTFFEQNSDKFRIGTKIKASHILVGTEKEANDILERINKGEIFSNLAKSLSKDRKSAENGGDIGYLGQGQTVPEFEKALLSLKPGEVSSPVKTRYGYHIIKNVEIKKGELANFEQAKESIKRQLLAQKRKNVLDSYIAGLMEKADITKNEDILATITLPWQKAEVKTPQPEKQPEAK